MPADNSERQSGDDKLPTKDFKNLLDDLLPSRKPSSMSSRAAASCRPCTWARDTTDLRPQPGNRRRDTETSASTEAQKAGTRRAQQEGSN
jgi:hypothetical protein